MASYRLREKAIEDLDLLYEFGILTFGLQQADSYYDGLIARFQEIADNPLFYPTVDHIRAGYRLSIYGVHSIYFYIKEDYVEIVRVLGRQDPTKQLLE